MKKLNNHIKFLFILITSLLVTSCVHDDKYDAPNLDGYQCADLTATKTIAQVKALYTGTTYVFPSTSTDIMEGYVSSSDETGNIYKSIYIQDSPTNPTQGFLISVDAVSTYAKFPQGSKIYIKLNDLALGTYGGLVQLGVKDASVTTSNGVARIPESEIAKHIFRSCTTRAEIIPKVMTLADMKTANDQYLGCLVQVNDAEFDKKVLCATYAPDGISVDRQINDPGTSLTTRVVRNSGFASFANQILPAGKGKFIGILSKFNSTYQMYVNRASDLADMTHFPRKDGIAANPCSIDVNSLTTKTVAEVKQMFSGALTQITTDAVIKVKVTANDETGNLFKYVYVEDATGGIRVNVGKTNLYQDARFMVGQEIYIKIKDLYIGSINGELQLGQPFNGNVGQIAETDVYKYFFDSNKPITTVIPTERTITQLTTADVGRWIKIRDLEFIDSDLGKPYAQTTTTNRTLKDCSGNTIILRTSSFASFAGTEVDGGKGDVYAILSIFNGTYQLWIPKLIHADLDHVRCDGSTPPQTIFNESFSGALTDNWSAVSVTGAQVWNIQNFGNPSPCAVMNGYLAGNNANEDWLISKSISLSGLTSASLTFDTDGRYTGNVLEAYVTENYTGNPATTTWVQLPAVFDTNLGAFNTWTSSGSLNLNSYVNKSIRIAFKYTSTTSACTTWELDNVKVKGQ